jgi:predicted nucleic acid-binding protein
MNAYIDSSVLLRLLLGEPKPLRQWRDIELGVASALAEVECLRTLDRLRVRGTLPETALAEHRAAVYDLMEALEMVDIGRTVLSRAASPFPTSLGTLDAIHLATAMAYRDMRGVELGFATHDAELAVAARSVGFAVIGV